MSHWIGCWVCDNQAEFFLAVSLWQFDSVCYFTVDYGSIWTAFRVFSNTNYYLCVWYPFWSHFRNYFYCRELCKLHIWVWRIWDCYICCLFVVLDGDTFWDIFAYIAKAWLCKYWALGRCNIFSFASKQCLILNGDFACILYHCGSSWSSDGMYSLTKAEKLHNY